MKGPCIRLVMKALPADIKAVLTQPYPRWKRFQITTVEPQSDKEVLEGKELLHLQRSSEQGGEPEPLELESLQAEVFRRVAR
jgi:hypothetical protein